MNLPWQIRRKLPFDVQFFIDKELHKLYLADVHRQLRRHSTLLQDHHDSFNYNPDILDHEWRGDDLVFRIRYSNRTVDENDDFVFPSIGWWQEEWQESTLTFTENCSFLH